MQHEFQVSIVIVGPIVHAVDKMQTKTDDKEDSRTITISKIVTFIDTNQDQCIGTIRVISAEHLARNTIGLIGRLESQTL